MKHYGRKKQMKKILIFTFLLSILAYLSVVYFEKIGSGELYIVKINQEKISKNDIAQKISQIFSSQSFGEQKMPKIDDLPQDVLESFARQIYLERKLVKKAKKSLGSDENVAKKIAQSRRQILIDEYLQKTIQDNLSDKKIKEKYLEISNNLEGKKEYLISHIVVEDEKLANNIYGIYKKTPRSQKARKFSWLAKKYSVDLQSAKESGNLGYVLQDDIAEEVLQNIAVFKKVGYTKPIKTEFGWHIVLVSDIRKAKIAPFEESRDAIRARITKDVTDEIYQDIFSNAKIKFLNKRKKSINEQK